MSGGSYDYVYSKIEDIIINSSTPERIAFQKHLKLVAKAMKDIEWVDSCDKSPGDESEAIRKCLSPIAVVSESDHTCPHCGTSFQSVKLKKYCSVKCRSAAIYRRAVADGRRSTTKNRMPTRARTGSFPTLEERNRRVKFCG